MIRALAIICLLASHARAEMCFSGPMFPRPVTSQKSRVAGSGGMIVVGDKLPDWRFRVLNKIVRPRVVVLAPGLAIYHPPPLPGDEVVLEDTDHQLMARAQRVFSIEAPLEPPAPAKVTSTNRGRYTQVIASFPRKIPAAARVLVVTRVDAPRAAPIAWAFVAPSASEATVWHSPYGCDEHVTGWLEPKVGYRVVLTWVDDAGRVSEPSKPLTISAASKGK